MLVTLKNTGLGLRIFHDAKTKKQHFAKPGQSVTLEVHDRIVDRYKRGQTRGEPLEIEIGEQPDPVDQNFTLKEGEHAPAAPPPGMGSVQQAQALDAARQGATRQELEGRMPQRKIESEDPPPQRHHDPVTANAERQAGNADNTGAEGQQGSVEQPKEPATVQELIQAIEAGGVSEADQLRLARAVLPRNTLPQRPKPAQIMAALQRVANK